jgi:hypothetical protein
MLHHPEAREHMSRAATLADHQPVRHEVVDIFTAVGSSPTDTITVPRWTTTRTLATSSIRPQG